MIGISKNNRENYPRKCFRTQEKETRVKVNPGLSANRPSNNWALFFGVQNKSNRTLLKMQKFTMCKTFLFWKGHLAFISAIMVGPWPRYSKYSLIRHDKNLLAEIWHFLVMAILRDPRAVGRVGKKRAPKVFKNGRKSPWVPTLTHRRRPRGSQFENFCRTFNADPTGCPWVSENGHCSKI